MDYVETDKSHIILHELEENWWILAVSAAADQSIPIGAQYQQLVDMTRLPADSSKAPSSQRNISDAPQYHYSSREMCPPHLLIQQLRRAHSTFLLHHDFSLESMYQRIGRPAFCTILDSYWRKFAWNWEVLLSGNPAIDMYNGIKLSAGGELGVGVGEEEWGSGEREVLEDFVSRTDGLVDLIVSRFGDPYMPEQEKARGLPGQPPKGDQWLGLDVYPRPSDGVIFSGVGGISRRSVANITQWMELIYRYGTEAYGVGEDPTSPRRRKRRRRRGRAGRDADGASGLSDNAQATSPDRGFSPGIPRPLVVGGTQSSQVASGSDGQGSSFKSSESSPARSERGSDWMPFRTDTFVKYLTLGYGSSWGPSSESPSPHPRVEALKQESPSGGDSQGDPPGDQGMTLIKKTSHSKDRGNFLIGLLNDTSNPDGQSVEEPVVTNDIPTESNEVITQRTLHVHPYTSDQDITGKYLGFRMPALVRLLVAYTAPDPVKLRTVVYVVSNYLLC